MRAEYKRDMNHNYLILHGDKEIDTTSYQVRMLVGNAVPSLLKCRVQGMDGKFMVYYDVTSRQPVSTLYEQKKFGIEDLRLIFGGFVQVMEEMSEYLLNPGELVIRPEYIYIDIEKRECFFCYLPGFQQDVREQFQALTEYVLPKLDHEDGKAVMLGYGVYRRALEDSFHLEHIKEELYHVQDRIPGEKAAKQPEMMDELFGREEAEQAAEGWIRNVTPDGRNSSRTTKGWNSSGTPDGSCRAGKQLKNGEKLLKDKTESENDSFRREDINAKGNRRENTGKKYSLKGKEKSTEGADASKGALWKRIICCAVAALILLGVIAAKLLGYLPGIEIESILGVILVCMGIGMVIYKIYTGRRKNLPKTAQAQSDQMYNSGKEADYKKENIEKGYLYRREFDFESNEKEIFPAASQYGSEDKSQEQVPPPESCGETVILSENPVAGPASLVSREPGELATIFLKDDLTVIGKLETAADAVVNLPTVSRVHAKIKKKDGVYYLSDLNSRNGTSVNGRILKLEEEYPLQDQDEVDFAQARFVFLE